VTFDTIVTNVPAPTIDIGNYNGNELQTGDIALMTLNQEISPSISRYDIYRQSSEIGSNFAKVGYGRGGDGNQGQVLSAGTKRNGQNRIESYGRTLNGTDFGAGSLISNAHLVFDFDNGSSPNDAAGVRLGIHNLGLGSSEVGSAPGDSGGPAFINGQIAGITSFGYGYTGGPDVIAGTNSSFGEMFVDTRVSAYASWIDSLVDIIAPTAPGGLDLTVTSDSGVFSNDDITNDTTPTFTWTAANGTGSTIAGYWWAVDDATPATGGTFTTSLSATPSTPGNGNHTFYVAAVDSSGNIGSASSLLFQIDTVAPRIGNVTISGSSSTHAPFVFDNPNDDLNDFDGFGIQLRTVPVGGANRLAIQFNEGVGNVVAASLSARALTFGSLATLATGGFSYANGVGTWMFNAPLTADQHLITLLDTVTDLAGNALDGEWTNPFSVNTSSTAGVSVFPSGNGTAGGQFKFVFTILPGDANLNNYVEGNDFLIWQQNIGPSNRTFTQADYNGDGVANIADNTIWQQNSGKHLMDLVFADFNHDGQVNQADLDIILGHFGATNASHADGDVDDDGNVNGLDWMIWQRQNGLTLSWVS
jgi:hypothetical protein